MNDEGVGVGCVGMTASRLMVSISLRAVGVLVVWDWRIGDIVRAIDFRSVHTLIHPPMQVLKWSSGELNFLRRISTRLAFLDEFRLVAMSSVSTVHEDEPDLVIFDTSIPQKSPDSWRSFSVSVRHPRNTCGPPPKEFWVHTDSNRAQGGGPCDGPLVVDPAQSVIILVTRFPRGREVFLVVRVAALVGHMSSARTHGRIPWDEWKRDVMAVELPLYARYYKVFVLGFRVLLMASPWRGDSYEEDIPALAYDFSRWGRRALVGGGKKRIFMPNPKEPWTLHRYNGRIVAARAFGDSIASYGVSDLLEPPEHAGRLFPA